MTTDATIKGLAEKLRTCERCGSQYIGDKRASYCSGACRVAAFRARNPDKRRKAKSE